MGQRQPSTSTPSSSIATGKSSSAGSRAHSGHARLWVVRLKRQRQARTTERRRHTPMDGFDEGRCFALFGRSTKTPIDGQFFEAYSRGPMSKGPVRPPLLGDLESAVMNHLWAGGDGDAKAVHEKLGKRLGITLNTVQSTLKRL